MRTLILAHGEEPSAALLKKLRSKAGLFIAADGGGNTALKLGYPPDIITGDMDSFRDYSAFSGEVLQDSNQETNDLEKALHLARKKGATQIDVLGAIGKRLDHTLKNLSVLQQFDSSFDLLAFYDDRFIFRILPVEFTAVLPVGNIVSLFPLSGKVTGIVTEGLKYPLQYETLENGRRDGSSNETTEKQIRITHRTGTLLFMTELTESLF